LKQDKVEDINNNFVITFSPNTNQSQFKQPIKVKYCENDEAVSEETLKVKIADIKQTEI
jgi:hypothetical protein